MRSRRAPRPLTWLGALLVLYLGYPVGAFVVRAAGGGDEGWNASGLWPALRISVEGATVSLAIGVLGGIPLAYVLARRRGLVSEVVSVIVQLPLAVPPLISGIILVEIVGPYTFLGRLSGQRLTQTFLGVVIAQSFVSAPFLVVVARSAFSAVDPALDDVAATLGHGPLGRFLRVDVPAASDGLRTGMILMWLRAFGEYGTTVVLAYHPYSLPIYVDNLFSSAPLSQAQAPTILAFAVAAIAIALGRLPRLARARAARPATPRPPDPTPPVAVGFDLDTTVGGFRLRAAHREAGHRLAILGPSGSGKTLMLRGIAGLLGPGAGEVRYGERDVTGVRTEQRRLGYVPQGFGLLPARTVARQVAFGADADPGVAAWWLDTLGLAGLEGRRPEELSGGQRQRVSLARALAVGPRLLLLDEPFSALDAPVRRELRAELRRLQRDAGLSTVLVTHDAEEAAMLADEVIVLDGGRVLQAGACAAVFRRPGSLQIGRLLGLENLVEGVVDRDGRLRVAEGVSLPAAALAPGTRALGRVAAEGLHLTATGDRPEDGAAHLELGEATVRDVVDLGRVVETTVELADGYELRARAPVDPGWPIGSRCLAIAERDAVSAWAAEPSPAG